METKNWSVSSLSEPSPLNSLEFMAGHMTGLSIDVTWKISAVYKSIENRK
jgi:hypothetical protein